MSPLLRNDLLMIAATVIMVALIGLTGFVAASTPILVSYLYGGVIGLVYGAVFVRWNRERARLKGAR